MNDKVRDTLIEWQEKLANLELSQEGVKMLSLVTIALELEGLRLDWNGKGQ